jgi:hypothetical protein
MYQLSVAGYLLNSATSLPALSRATHPSIPVVSVWKITVSLTYHTNNKIFLKEAEVDMTITLYPIGKAPFRISTQILLHISPIVVLLSISGRMSVPFHFLMTLPICYRHQEFS